MICGSLGIRPVVLVAASMALRTGVFAFIVHRQTRGVMGKSSSTFTLLSSEGNFDAASTSVGDLVQNLHGGKYIFSETQYLAGGSSVGKQFAESLYSGTNEDDEEGGEEELPKWALRLQDTAEQSTKPVLGILRFNQEQKVNTVSVTNEERSWEKFYAIVHPPGDGTFVLSPVSGSLAPRGGASNACDETKPYPDSATIAVEWVGQYAGGVENDRLLVIGTEAEVWRYYLSVV